MPCFKLNMAGTTDSKTRGRHRRHARIRATVSGTPERPRLAVFRSNKAISAQLIDDTTGTTLAAAQAPKAGNGPKEVGAKIAELAQKQNIKSVVFDRGGFLYAGKVQAVADGAREAGLVF